MHRDDLLTMMTLVDESLTPQGRYELGLKEEDVPKIDGLVRLLLSQSKSKIKIATAERQIWEAYGAPPADRTPKMEHAKADLVAGLMAFPVAYSFYDVLFQDDGNADLFDVGNEAHRISYVALQRALSRTPISKSIHAKDLLSPFDKKPVGYSLDGRQIVITVSAPDKEIVLKLPSDAQLAKAAKS